LLNGLLDDWQPQGKTETFCVEELAATMWRKRRFFQAENAEVTEKMEYTDPDFRMKQHVEAWEGSRAAIGSGGLLKYLNNPLAIREAIETLKLLRLTITNCEFNQDSRLLKKLYGEDQDGGIPYGLRLVCEVYATIAKVSKANNAESGDSELKEIIFAFIDG